MPIFLDSDNSGAAKAWCTALNVAAIGVGFWVIIAGTSTAPIYMAMLLPLVALLMLKYSGGVVTLDTNRGTTRPTVAGAFLTPGAFLAVRAFGNWHVLDWGNFWLPFALIFGFMNGVSLLLAREVLLRDKKILYCLLVCAVYGYGATVNLNGVLDTSPHTTLHADVLNKHTVHGKGTSYYLTLSAWGARTASQDVSVSARVYNGHSIGSQATIDMRKGFFGMPYFFVW